jgi:hypothetical protein
VDAAPTRPGPFAYPRSPVLERLITPPEPRFIPLDVQQELGDGLVGRDEDRRLPDGLVGLPFLLRLVDPVEKGEKIKPMEIVGPGKSLPNYTVAPGDDLRMMSESITVSRDTLLSEILKPNMGPVHLAICRKHCDPRR